MIRLPNHRKNDSGDQIVDLTSLIDVLFTLLIFFILAMGATHITTEISLPGAQHYQSQLTKGIHPLVIEISHKKATWKFENLIYQSFSEFQKGFLAKYQSKKNQPILLGLEKSLPVERLTELLNFLSVNQFSNIQIVSEWKI